MAGVVLTFRCHGLRITTNDQAFGPVDAVVWDANGARLAGPFAQFELAIEWIKKNRLGQARGPTQYG